MVNVIKLFVFWFLRCLSKLNLDSKSYVVYDYTFGYDSHSKALYDYYVRLFPNARVYFVTNKPRFDNNIEIDRKSLKGLALLLFCRNFAINVGMPSYIDVRDKVVVQFWHGTPMKSLGVFDHSVSDREKRNRCLEFSYYNKIIVQNQLLADALIESYCIVDSKSVLVSSNPYLDSIVAGRINNQLQSKNNVSEKRRKIVYLPTYRNTKQRNWDLSECPNFIDFVYNNNYDFIARYHPSDDKYDSAAPTLTHVLSEADIVITDYSSVAFDSFESGITTLLYWEDVEEYSLARGVDRKFMSYYDFPIFYSESNLIEGLSKLKLQSAIYCTHDLSKSKIMEHQITTAYL
ncbi:hypothetical protein BCT91_19140 [Vibrio cyclitrophicus]|uniref:CDP-glycerol glycerophosphotransferase family protein n=1 Tax=Vibrio cyclitrophicus TaxID=47951 RepID=UPI000C8380FC|nr:CDP-glycerol glycerophosphotransferase family protein [Vibrio cyclitrophicus]PMK81658.1 hypothetical protein BCT91_19140 [Vibrio cyclitrophicus]